MNKECFECGKPATEEHHVIPQSLGGEKTIPLCGGCHALVHGGYNKRRDDHIELVKAGHARARAKGVKFGFQHPAHEGKHAEYIALAHVEIERLKIEFAESVIQRILELRNTLMSVNDIAETLNSEGVKTARGGKWYGKSVSNILDTLNIPFRDINFLGKLSYTPAPAEAASSAD